MFPNKIWIKTNKPELNVTSHNFQAITRSQTDIELLYIFNSVQLFCNVQQCWANHIPMVKHISNLKLDEKFCFTKFSKFWLICKKLQAEGDLIVHFFLNLDAKIAHFRKKRCKGMIEKNDVKHISHQDQRSTLSDEKN